jgi:hypothetical protein
MVELYLLSPYMSSWHDASLIKHRDSFTFALFEDAVGSTARDTGEY